MNEKGDNRLELYQQKMYFRTFTPSVDSFQHALDQHAQFSMHADALEIVNCPIFFFFRRVAKVLIRAHV